jgi:multiple sugar transport system permease protein
LDTRLKKAAVFIFVAAVATLMIYPLLWMFSSSLKPNEMIFQDLSLWPAQITFDNYIKGWQGIAGIPFTTFFRNSFIVVIAAIVANLLTCSMAAYAFARLNFAAKPIFFAAMLMTMMLPQHVVLIPQYIIFFRMDWVDTFLPLTVPRFLATDAFFIFLMVQFIRGIPLEIDDAATVDGCSPVGIYWRMILPLLVPALVTTSIFTFIWTWNDFFSQLIYLSNPKLYTVSLALRAFNDTTGASSWGSLFAMSIVSLIPIFAMFIVFQRYLVEGIATTGLKR